MISRGTAVDVATMMVGTLMMFEAFTKVFEHDSFTWLLQMQLEQLETTLLNRRILPFKISFIAHDYGSTLVYLWGLAQGYAALGMIIKGSHLCINVLIVSLLLDTFVLNVPFTQISRDLEKAIL